MPRPRPTVSVVKVPAWLVMPNPTATTEPTPELTVAVEPTSTPEPPTATAEPTPEPRRTVIVITATPVPTTNTEAVAEMTAVAVMTATAAQSPPTPEAVVPVATPEPPPTPEVTDTSPPYIIVVDFYSGNTFSDPGPGNCNPQRCGAAFVQFSEPVLINGSPIIDVLGKGLIECIEGCSNTDPSPYMILSGSAWIEPGDVIIDSRIIMDGGGSITDVYGNVMDSYVLGSQVTARYSDFAMVPAQRPYQHRCLRQSPERRQ